MKEYFLGRKLVIATMHGKERVLKPLLELALGVECILPMQFNSDLFGTFSGEVERMDNPLETALKKCNDAMAITNTSLAVASEGSFGSHPFIGLIPVDEEILVLVDKENGYTVKTKELSTATNFNGKTVSSIDEAILFSESAQFPSHALILRKAENDFSEIYKGVVDPIFFKQRVSHLLSQHGSVYIETDMRANFNPSRMLVIEATCKKLIDTIKHRCKNCGVPGFSISEIIGGLPCSFCGTPTQSTKAVMYSCEKCSYKEQIEYPNSKTVEDPMYCDRCNP